MKQDLSDSFFAQPYNPVMFVLINIFNIVLT